MTESSFADVEVGHQIPHLSVVVDRARLVQYAAASGDRNPIHWDEVAAREAGLPDVIAHGMFTMAAAVEAVSDWAGHGGCITGYQAKFISPLPVPRDGGAVIEVDGTVIKVDPQDAVAIVELSVTSGGTKVLGRPLVTVRLD